MKNAKGNILITGIIIILIVLILGGVSFGIYKFFSMSKQVVNSKEFENTFENAVFTRSKLIQQLNHEGSKMREKKKEVKPAEPKAE